MTKLRLAFLLVFFAGMAAAQEPRIASDFEIATAQKQVTRERDPLLKMAAHLNLGDLYLTRQEAPVAREHYRQAEALANTEQLRARRHSDLNAYSIASAYLGLAFAKQNRAADAFDAFEEAMRYASDSAKLWNLYASGMSLVGKSPKAVAAAQRAVDIADRAAQANPTQSTLLDVSVYRYALASALIATDTRKQQAAAILERVIEVLESPAFDELRDEITRREKFEVFSTTRGDADSYLSLMNRSRLRLARVLEERGETDQALAQLREVLELRSDDAAALTAMARISAAGDREQFFAEAFDANPFSMDLLQQYERWVAETRPAAPQGTTVSRLMQRAVHAYAVDRPAEAAATIESLRQRFPENDAVKFLSRRLAEIRAGLRVPDYLVSSTTGLIPLDAHQLSELITLIRADQLSPQQRVRLDEVIFQSPATFDPPISSTPDTTTFQTGSIGPVSFRFQQPTEFRGTFPASTAVQMEFRVLGVGEESGAATLIVEPLRISRS